MYIYTDSCGTAVTIHRCSRTHRPLCSCSSSCSLSWPLDGEAGGEETGHVRTTGDMYAHPPSHYPGIQGVSCWPSPAASCSGNSFLRLQPSPLTQSLSAVQSRLPQPPSPNPAGCIHTLEPSPAVLGPKSSGRSSHPDDQEIGNKRVPENSWTSPSPMRKLRSAGSASPRVVQHLPLANLFSFSLCSLVDTQLRWTLLSICSMPATPPHTHTHA